MVKYCRSDQLAVWLSTKIKSDDCSLLSVLNDIQKGNVPDTDVIPVDWIKSWHKKHYKTDVAPMLSDWKEENKQH